MSPRFRVHVARPLATVALELRDPVSGVDADSWRSLAQAFRFLSERRDVAAVVVRGSGGRGLDGLLKTPESSRDVPVGDDGSTDQEMAAALAAVRGCEQPTVALIEGVCLGVDLEIAAACDLRICGESSRFGAPLPRSTPTRLAEQGPLEELLGQSPVLAVLRGGELLDAARALAVGLVNHVCADRAVVEQGYGLAARVAAGAPLVNRWHKNVVRLLHDRATEL